MMIQRPNNHGIALIFVLGMITLIAALVAQFGFTSQIQLRIAYAERDRLQAEYLARSGLNFLRLLMVQEKSMKSLITQLSGGKIDPKIPLCKQFPLSTELLRAVFATGAGGGDEEGAKETGKKSEKNEKPSEKKDTKAKKPAVSSGDSQRIITAFDTAAVEEFLGFRGDFDGACDDEAAKINLNHFADLKSTEPTIGGLNPYDRYKDLMTRVLLQPKVRKLFGEHPDDRVALIVRNIADWIDTDDLINERPGVVGGAEQSVYDDRGGEFKIRNGKMATLDELFLVEGVTDEWFTPLRPYFTIYGKEKINICTAEPLVVEALIMSYAATNQRVTPINPDDHKRVKKIIDAVALQCADLQPTPQKISQVVENALMGADPAAAAAPGAPAPPLPAGQPGAATGAGGTFVDWIDLTGGPYQLVGTGRVTSGASRETVVKITAVYDTTAPDTKQWKLLYWNMQ